MKRSLSAVCSALTVGFLFTATAATATPITAQLAEAPSERVQIIRNTAWVCNGGTCQTQRARSSANHECVRMSRELGMVTGFTFGDREFSIEELADCNGTTVEQQAQR